MAHETPTLEAKHRNRMGSRYAKRIRDAGGLPAVIYGHGSSPIAVTLDSKATHLALKHGQHVVNVKIEDGATETCLVKDLQFGYLGDNVIHVDLARVNLDEVVTVNVAMHYVGTPESAKKAGNIVTHDVAQLEVRCKVRDIPEEIRVDLAMLMHGLTLTLGELKLPPGVTPTHAADTVVCRIQTVAETVVAAEAAPAGAEAAAAPEVITAKKEEKPEEGKAPAR